MSAWRLSPKFDTWRRRAVIALTLAYVGGVVVLPLLALLAGAFSQGMEAVAQALSRPAAQAALGRTLGIAVLTVLTHAVLGTLTAWVLVRQRFWGRAVFAALVDLPFALSAVVAGYMLLLIFGRTGWLGPTLAAWGWRVAFDWPGLWLATVFVTLPFMIRELMPVLEALGVEQEQAAATLGASGWQTFWWVTFPALRGGLIHGLTLTFARALGEFGAALVIGGGIQGRTDTATVFVYQALEAREVITAYSVALALGVLALALVLGAERWKGKPV